MDTGKTWKHTAIFSQLCIVSRRYSSLTHHLTDFDNTVMALPPNHLLHGFVK